jgi:hypothetical protein
MGELIEVMVAPVEVVVPATLPRSASDRDRCIDLGMADEALRAQWTDDATALAQIGAALFAQSTRLKVRVPRELAEAALAAWTREDIESESDEQRETHDQAITRARAGSFALIGAAIEKRGEPADDDHVTVDLDAWFVGHALDAADDAGLIQ